MNPIKKIWRNVGSRVWAAMAVVLLIILIASVIVTQVGFLRNTVNIVFGGERAITADGGEPLYTADYKTKSEVFTAAKEFNVSLAEEGIILLKNENQALPLAKGAKISVFGKNSVNLVYGGSGSSGANGSDYIDLYKSLSDAGFNVNPKLKSFYEGNASGSGRGSNPNMGDIVAGFATGETPVSSYTSDVKNSYSDYNDAAVVVISRIGGEGYDLPRSMRTGYDASTAVAGAASADDHYLQLDKNEQDMLKEAYANFSKVVLILNTSTTVELGFTTDKTDPLYSDKLQAVLWMGFPGSTGATAVGEVLNGTVNPSGHTTDTYVKDFKQDPSWYNIGNNNVTDGDRYTVGGAAQEAYFVEYEEGIYVGYRYWETRGFTDGEEWYKDHVVYPFGYGLSYTDFRWEVEEISPADGSTVTADGKITVKVRVYNDGDADGKEVVQLYFTAPYTAGGIEKAYVELCAFEKVEVKAGHSETVTLEFDVADMKSYDYKTVGGYVLEAGDYQVRLARNAHDFEACYTYKLAATERIEEGKTENRFDDVSSYIEGRGGYLTRDGWKNFPTAPTAADRETTSEFITSLKYVSDDAGKPWYTDTMPVQSASEVSKENVTVTLRDMIGKSYEDEAWDELLNQLTINQMRTIIGTASYCTEKIENIGKPRTYDEDGAAGFTNFMSATDSVVYNTCFYAAESVIGATWNKELAYEMGRMIGNEGLIGNERGDKLPYSGWYSPAVNIHRSQFGGRNWEYYSEDGFFSGKIAAQVVKGAQSKGVYCYVKHFAVNDQETNRDNNGICVWLNEQAMREIYFEPFELAVKEGGASAIMSSFNRLGTVWAGGNYALLTQVLRDEWGFKGMVITDYALKSYMNANQMIRAGGDLKLNQESLPSSKDVSATHISSLRRATKNILYTVGNSCAMNLEIIGYKAPVWTIVLLWIDILLTVGIAVWGFFSIRKALRKPDEEKNK